MYREITENKNKIEISTDEIQQELIDDCLLILKLMIVNDSNLLFVGKKAYSQYELKVIIDFLQDLLDYEGGYIVLDEKPFPNLLENKEE